MRHAAMIDVLNDIVGNRTKEDDNNFAVHLKKKDGAK